MNAYLLAFILSFSNFNVKTLKNSDDFIKLQVNVNFSGYPLKGDGFVVDSAGYPELPLYYVKIALPPDRDVSKITVEPTGYEYKKLKPPVPIPHYIDDGLTPIYKEGEIYKSSSIFPSKTWSLAGGGFLRHVRYKLIKIYPFKYDFGANRLIVVKGFNINVSLKPASKRYAKWRGKDSFEALYRYTFPNYRPDWKVSLPSDKPSNPFDNASIWIKIKTIEGGLYKISGASLEAIGVHLPVATNHLVLYNSASDTLRSLLSHATNIFYTVPLKVVDNDGNGLLDRNDYIIFYARGMKRFWFRGDSIFYFEHPYSDTNVYWLGVGSSDHPLPIESVTNFRNGIQDTVTSLFAVYRHDINTINPAEKGLRWVGEILRMHNPPGSAEYTFNFSLNDLASPDGGGIVVPVLLLGSTYFDVYLNNTRYIQSSPLYAVHDDTFRLVVNNLREGSNELKIVMRAIPGRNDTLNYGNLDFFEFQYQKRLLLGSKVSHYYNKNMSGWHVLKIRSTTTPLISKIKGGIVTIFENLRHNGDYYLLTDSLMGKEEFVIQKNYLTPISLEIRTPSELDLRDQNWRVDYLIIGKEMFRSTLMNYMSYRRNHLYMPDSNGGHYTQGDVKFVPLERIYEEFGFGVADPVSIRNFIYFVYHNSVGPPPTYVLFVGDGNYDYKNFAGAASYNLFPPFEPWNLIDINDNFHGALDAFYADVAPDTGFIMEDIFYGRICARTRSDLRDYLDKVMVYESGQSNGPWRNRVMLVADDEYNNDTHTHHETVHTLDSDDLYRHYIPHSVEVMTHYLINYPFDQNMMKPQARRDFKRKYNIGHLLINIFMHGNPTVLAHERMFIAPQDYADIHAGFKNSFLIIASCKVGAYDRIVPARVIAEEFSLKKGGSIAVLSSTNSTYSSANDSYVTSMLSQLKTYRHYALGELSFFGKNNEFYVLLGDPTVAIGYSRPDSALSLNFYHNGVTTDTLTAAGRFLYRASGLSGGTRYYIRMFESKKDTTYRRNWGTDVVSITYQKAPVAFYSGVVEASNSDTISRTFTVPVSLTTGNKAFAYIYRMGEVGLRDSITILPSTGIPPGNRGPTIKLFLNGKELQDSSSVPQNFLLQVYLSDSDGINLTNSISPTVKSGIQLEINNDAANSIDLTPYFNYEKNSSTSGYAIYPLNLTNPGLNLVKITAYDNLKTPTVKTYSLYVQTAENFRLRDFYIYPNPIRDRDGTYITFVLSSPARVSISIFTIAGTPIWKSGEMMLQEGFHKIYWNGRDMDGDYPANGLYFLTLNVEGASGDKVRKIEKILIAR